MPDNKASNRELERLKTLLSYGILDTPIEKEFDDLAELASVICDTPIAIISVIDDKRQWYKAKVGIDINEVKLEETFCQYTMAAEDFLEIPNATLDPRVRENPKVKGENGIRFYAGYPLKAENGYCIGTLCVVGTQPQQLSEIQKKSLSLIANQVMVLLEARKKNLSLAGEVEKVLASKIKETKNRLQKLKMEYDHLFQAISKSSGVVEFSPEGIITGVNKNFQDIIGYSEKELMGKPHRILLDKKDISNNLSFWKSLKNGEFQSGRLMRIHKSGEKVWIQASYNPVMDKDGKVRKVIKVAQNVSMEVKSLEALEGAKKMSDNLNIQKDHFIANMSHEIRTPINAVLGFTELLLEQEYSPAKLDYLNSIKAAGDSLLHIVNDILDLSKIETGIFQIEKSPFNLRDTIENVFKMFRLKATQKKIHFNHQLQEDLPLLLIGDKNRLSQILINLLGNAFKFTSAGAVSLAVAMDKKVGKEVAIRFDVQDTGIGIPKDKLEMIFHRFSQAEDHTTRTYGGTGLGLNICKLLIEKQAGTINVSSQLGIGSTFSFIIPYTLMETPPPAYSKASPAYPEQTIPLKILLFEDNILNQKLMEAVFSRTDHELDIAVNGEEGLNLLSIKKFDIIFMDIQMPIMDGYQTTLKIRENIDKNIPIIALTAHSMMAEKDKCISFGMNDYLSKPINKKDLMDKLNFWTAKIGENSEKHTKSSTNRYISLNQLIDLTQGDSDFQREMIEVFIKQTDETVGQIADDLKKGNMERIVSLAHKLKTSFGILEASTRHLSQIEYKAKAGEPREEIEPSLDALHLQITSIYQELNQILHQYEAK
ncbi:ATP-binding protein [Pleomorphovibrio marinus]|uniref:ATP-binding protein n=1 Tax=Pleomorphovibrio marinus TaxID=2164132 RepID=UPI000E0A43F6|nr:ATP-binding protein [Pleomorphovibrio marinus]